MIDPPYDQALAYRDGDEGVLPTATGGPLGESDIGIDTELSRDKWSPIYAPTLLTLGAAGSATDSYLVDLGDIPDYWSISGLTSPNTNTEIWIWAEAGPYGEPYAVISGTGSAKISGVTQFLYVSSRGTSAVRTLIRAVRGYQFSESTY